MLVSFSDAMVVCTDATEPGLDSKGNLYYGRNSGGLWRLNSGETEAKMLGGKGTRKMRWSGDKASLQEVKLDPYFMTEIREGVFWCVSYEPPSNIIYQVDLTGKGEVEVVISGVGGTRQGKEDGKFGNSKNPGEPSAIVRVPRGPFIAVSDNNGGALSSKVYFRDGNARVAITGPNSVNQIKTLSGPIIGEIQHPSLLQVDSELANGKNQETTNPNLAWVNVGNGTNIGNLEIGHSGTLSKTVLLPLITIEPYKTLAVQIKQWHTSAIIVLVDWQPLPGASSSLLAAWAPSDFDEKRIKPICQLPITFKFDSNPRFFYHSKTNALHVYDHANFTITRYSDIFSSFLLLKKFSAPVATSFSCNLSKLLEKECPLPGDFEIVHSISNTTWKVHYDVIKNYTALQTDEAWEKLASVVKSSALSSTSISSFLSMLYFSPPTSLMPLCHCIQLCNQIGIESSVTSYLLWLLDKQIVPTLTIPELLHNTLTLCVVEQDPSPESIATYAKTSPIMSILASRCRKYATDGEIELALDAFFRQSNITPSASLIYSIGPLLSPASSLKLEEPEMSANGPLARVLPLTWDKKLSVSSRTPPADPHAYIFTIEGLEYGGMVCNSLILYPQWKWFERLTKTLNCQEVVSRHVVMPTAFSPALLLAIISVTYGRYQPGITIRTLSSSDIACVYRFKGQLHLTDSPIFASFIQECQDALFTSVTEENVLEKIQLFLKAGIEFNSPVLIDTLALAYKNRAKISMADLSALPFQIQIIICAYMADPEKFEDSDFSAISTDLQQCQDLFPTK